MSRIGRKSIPVPAGVDITIDGQTVKVKGPKGELQPHRSPSRSRSSGPRTAQLHVNRPNDERKAKELHGLSRTLVANMIVGVTEGYRKSLEIAGTGYRVTAKGTDLEFALGFSHPVRGPGAGRASPSRWSGRRCSTWPASTSSRSARSPPTSGRSARRSPTRARASSTRARSSAARLERQVRSERHAAQAPHAASPPSAPSGGRVGTSGSARTSAVPPSVRAWSSPARCGTSPPRSSTTPRATRWRRPRRWTPRSAAPRATRSALAGKVGALLAERAKAAGVSQGRLRPRWQPVRGAHRRAGRRRPRSRTRVLSKERKLLMPGQQRRGGGSGGTPRVAAAATTAVRAAAATRPSRRPRTSSGSSRSTASPRSSRVVVASASPPW